MKSKAPLALMEQMVMLLVFALAAALCLQAFVKSDEISLKSQAKSNAALAAQNTAEIIRHSGGSLEYALMELADTQEGKYLEEADNADIKLTIFYDGEWNPTEGQGDYLLTVQGIPVKEDGLQKVLIQVTDISGRQGIGEQTDSEDYAEPELLFELETAWLEVEGHE